MATMIYTRRPKACQAASPRRCGRPVSVEKALEAARKRCAGWEPRKNLILSFVFKMEGAAAEIEPVACRQNRDREGAARGASRSLTRALPTAMGLLRERSSDGSGTGGQTPRA